MPYSELHRRAKGQWESSTQAKMNSLADDLAFVPDNEFVELLWENGQIVMQGQTSKTRKGSLCPGKAQDKDGDDAVLPVPAKNGRYGTLDSVLHDLPLSGQEGNVGLVQDDEMVPWLNYPLDDSFERDYYSDIFPELSGVNLNSLSGQANTVPVDKSGNYGHGVRDSSHRVSSHSGSNVEQGNGPSKFVRIESEPTSNLHSSSKVRTSQLSSSECKSSLPAFRSGVPEFVSNNHQAFFENSSGKTPVLATGSFTAKIHQQDPRPSPASNMGAVNFSHFARPAALVRANLQNTGVATGLSSRDKLRSNVKMPATSSNLAESSLVDSSSVSKNVPGPMLPKVDSQSSSKPPQESPSVEQSETICQDEASGSKSRDRGLCQNSSFGASAAFGRSESGKAFEPVVTSSSVCSGNSAGRSSKDHKHGMKRKSREVEESGYQSEDVEGESVDVKKPSTGRSTNGKRSRAAEVHNLSERRRRDRINEKMRALQELIPNCNKVDKASMLDEAIEYLKTLQMQVQIMSMGSGLCMPPMMLPTGMQHMHTPHMARFSPMGVGMGMGMGMGMSMGFGMGMLDMSCSTSYPLIPVPSMHGAQIPCPSISGATSLPGVHGSGLQIFGIPGQGLSMPMPHGPYVPLSGFPGRTVPAPDMPTPPNTSLLPESVPTCSSKDQVDNINSQKMHKSSGDCS